MEGIIEPYFSLLNTWQLMEFWGKGSHCLSFVYIGEYPKLQWLVLNQWSQRYPQLRWERLQTKQHVIVGKRLIRKRGIIGWEGNKTGWATENKHVLYVLYRYNLNVLYVYIICNVLYVNILYTYVNLSKNKFNQWKISHHVIFQYIWMHIVTLQINNSSFLVNFKLNLF